MKKALSAITILMILSCTYAQEWGPAGEKLKTDWAEKVNPSNPLPEYPRPMMVRDEWKNLNGLWDYAITNAGSPKPEEFDGKILVPFAVESSLSGVQKTVSPENELWYECSFTVPSAWKKKRILLHFGAVDWKSDIWINDIKVGTHKGGYSPFSFDISPFLKESGEQILLVKIWDPTDKGYQPRGKQVLKPRGIFYTAVTGIWQTVWPEPEMYLFDGMRANVLGEYGGIGLAMEGHLWIPDKSWGYVQFKTSEEATDEYVKFAQQLMALVKSGFSAAVYTQTTDVEGEVNGLMTYDRKVVKMNLERIREVNKKICNSLND